MIQNLNRVSFQSFGTLINGRVDSAVGQVLQLSQADLCVYKAQSDTRLMGVGSMMVLAVSHNDSDYTLFYLDTPVQVSKDVYFCMIPVAGDAPARMICETAPMLVRHTVADMDPSLPAHADNLFTFFYQEKEMGFVFPGEAHPLAELTYVDRGSLHSVADGQDILLEQGDIVVYVPGQWHMQYADMDVAPRFVTISFSMKSDALDKFKGQKFRAPQQAVTLLQQMLREQERSDQYTRGMILALLNQLLLMLLRQTENPTPHRRLQASNTIHSENEIIRRAQQYISTHIREKLTVPIVASNVEVSASYLTALFHRNLQIAPGEYIRRIKLQESKQMIRENAMNFTEIAAALQYSTVHHFSRQFKEKFGITPSAYAKSVR